MQGARHFGLCRIRKPGPDSDARGPSAVLAAFQRSVPEADDRDDGPNACRSRSSNLHRRWRRPSSTRSDVGRRSAIRPLVSAPCLSRGSQQGAAAPLGRMTGPRPPATLFAGLRPSRRPPATGGAGRRGDQREPRSRGPAQGHPGVRFQKTDWGRGRPVSPRDFAEMPDHAPAPARASGAQANTANDGGRLGIPGCPKAGRQCGLSVRPSANERPAVATSAPRLPTMTASRRQRWQPTK